MSLVQWPCSSHRRPLQLLVRAPTTPYCQVWTGHTCRPLLFHFFNKWAYGYFCVTPAAAAPSEQVGNRIHVSFPGCEEPLRRNLTKTLLEQMWRSRWGEDYCLRVSLFQYHWIYCEHVQSAATDVQFTHPAVTEQHAHFHVICWMKDQN